MLIEGAIIGVILGKIRGGKLSNLGFLSIRAWQLIIIAFIIQIVLIFSTESSFLLKYGTYIYDFSLLLLVFPLCMNIDKKGVWAIITGVIINLLIIAIHGGKMPISFESLNLAGKNDIIQGIKDGINLRYMSLSHAKGFSKLFAKYIVIPKPYPLSKVMSIGDLLISLGIILLIQGGMIRSRFRNSDTRMIKFKYKGK